MVSELSIQTLILLHPKPIVSRLSLSLLITAAVGAIRPTIRLLVIVARDICVVVVVVIIIALRMIRDRLAFSFAGVRTSSAYRSGLPSYGPGPGLWGSGVLRGACGCLHCSRERLRLGVFGWALEGAPDALVVLELFCTVGMLVCAQL